MQMLPVCGTRRRSKAYIAAEALLCQWEAQEAWYSDIYSDLLMASPSFLSTLAFPWLTEQVRKQKCTMIPVQYFILL